MHWMAEKLQRSTQRNPQFGRCCNSGKIAIDPLEPLPAEIAALFDPNHVHHKSFIKDIRRYNSALAMTSTGQAPGRQLNIVHFDGRGPQPFKIQGALYHIIGSLLPAAGREPNYAQHYIYDPQDALEHRMNHRANNGLNRAIMQILQDVLYRNHRGVAIYKQAYDLARNADENHRIILRYEKETDRRRYNVPSANEIAIILPGDGDIPRDFRDIILSRHDGTLRRINELSPLYPALHYVLLFPTGQLQWHPRIEYAHRNNGPQPNHQQPPAARIEELNDDDDDVNPLPEDERAPAIQRDQRLEDVGDDNQDAQPQNQQALARQQQRPRYVTQAEYFRSRLHIHQNQSNHFFRAGKLFQEYVVDAWAVSEQSRLRWIVNNQDQIRAESYQGLADAINQNPDIDGNDLGVRTILPSSHTGSTRFMMQCCQDALAINRNFGGADLFLTATANPNWPEIQRELLPGQTATDRPDLVSRVFHLKMKDLLEDIFKNNILGVTVARVYTIEFQKRGLPHMHMIIFFERESKLRTAEDVDSLISAEFPDPVQQPELFELVKKFMVHGPCGQKNPNASCMENGKCIRNFPKPLKAETTLSEDSYACYRRRILEQPHQIGPHQLDNQWVVPYNAYLIRKYQCHINLESVFSMKSIKYIYKYVYKGHDRTTAEIRNRNDEVQQYLDARHISPCEGIWCLFEYHMHEEKPAVFRLQVHLENEQNVIWNADAGLWSSNARSCKQSC